MKRISVKDFFSKWGFCDGDNKKLAEAAFKARPKVIRLLNKGFHKLGLPYKAVKCDAYSHNSVRIRLIWEREGVLHDWDLTYGTCCMGETVSSGYPDPEVEVVFRAVQSQINKRRKKQ